MKIKQLIQRYGDTLQQQYGSQLLPSHRKALDAMLACRSQCGEFYSSCSHCPHNEIVPLSCGHRNCPQCQHNLGDHWFERQQNKLLPTPYYMVTFTLPSELRNTAWRNQSIVYEMLFKAAFEALQTVAKNNFKMKLGMTMVLHTHKRDKGYHPHLHIALPGGGVPLGDKDKAWKRFPQNFIINEFALANIFRAIFLRMFFEQSLKLPTGLPKQWVCNIRHVGQGEQALKYLSRYLYRGVISENDILTDQEGQVTFRYQESKTKLIKTKKQPAEEFLWTLLKHVLPRRFRRVRDYGFLHGNAKKLLEKIQTTLKMRKKPPAGASTKIKKSMPCKLCGFPMQIDLVIPRKIPMAFFGQGYSRFATG
jgi:hypothetical protein